LKEPFDVLEHHHQQNRPNNPPSVSRLTTATAQQERLNNPQPIESDHTTTNNSISSDDGDESQTSDSDQRAPRRKSEGGPSATTIQYYPGAWKTVLERAKNRFVHHVFLNQGFPVRNVHLPIAETILHEEIACGQAENLTLDNGKVLSFLCRRTEASYNIIFLAYEQTRKMNIVVSGLLYCDSRSQMLLGVRCSNCCTWSAQNHGEGLC
jgi:hypothetical protein